MLFYRVLEKETKKILPVFKNLKKDFYLAGGTGLALQLNHRRSYDLDFFSTEHFEPNKVFNQLEKQENLRLFKKLQDKSALFVEINDISVNFLYSKYKLIKKPIEDKYLKVAHFIDIACLKLSALTERIEYRDYVDIYFVLQEISLKELIKYFEKKIYDIDPGFVLKCLVAFEDVQEEKLELFKKVSFKKIKDFILNEVRKIVML